MRSTVVTKEINAGSKMKKGRSTLNWGAYIQNYMAARDLKSRTGTTEDY